MGSWKRIRSEEENNVVLVQRARVLEARNAELEKENPNTAHLEELVKELEARNAALEATNRNTAQLEELVRELQARNAELEARNADTVQQLESRVQELEQLRFKSHVLDAGSRLTRDYELNDEYSRQVRWRWWDEYDEVLDLCTDYFDTFDAAKEWWKYNGRCDLTEMVYVKGGDIDVAFGTALAHRYGTLWWPDEDYSIDHTATQLPHCDLGALAQKRPRSLNSEGFVICSEEQNRKPLRQQQEVNLSCLGTVHA